MPHLGTIRLGRRAFITNGTLVLAGPAFSALPAKCLLAGDSPREGAVRVGLVTDVHYADKPEVGSRYYRESLTKLKEATSALHRDNVATAIELGDFIDSMRSRHADEASLRQINSAFTAIASDRHYVLGNHCVESLSKNEFLGIIEQEKSFYSFDRGPFHFVLLDACFRSDAEPYDRGNFDWFDANIPATELEWLESDLKASRESLVIVFIHQRLDGSSKHGVKNAADIRRLLEQSGNVVAVFQGHSHENDYTQIKGIHYCTLRALVEGAGAENSGYSTMILRSNGEIRIDGYRQQSSYVWVPQR